MLSDADAVVRIDTGPISPTRAQPGAVEPCLTRMAQAHGAGWRVNRPENDHPPPKRPSHTDSVSPGWRYLACPDLNSTWRGYRPMLIVTAADPVVSGV